MAETTSSGKPGMNRRSFVYTTGATAIGAAVWGAVGRGDGAGSARADAPAVAHHHHPRWITAPLTIRGRPGLRPAAGLRPQTVHKNAAGCPPGDPPVPQGLHVGGGEGLLRCNDEHFNAMRHRHHGADVQGTAPPTVAVGETLAWACACCPGTGRSSPRPKRCSRPPWPSGTAVSAESG